MHRGIEARARSTLKESRPRSRYFLPAFSIRRGVDWEDEGFVRMQKSLKRVLGNFFEIQEPKNAGRTVIEKGRFLERMQEADAHPSPSQIRELAYTTRDLLQDNLRGTDSRIMMPTGKLAPFGANKNSLGIEPRGWKGYFARYALRDEAAGFTSHGVMVSESLLSVGAIAASFDGNRYFTSDGLATTPHIQIARSRGRIRNHELREIEERLVDIMPQEIPLTDPVIYLKIDRGTQPVPIYVRDPVRQAA